MQSLEKLIVAEVVGSPKRIPAMLECLKGKASERTIRRALEILVERGILEFDKQMALRQKHPMARR